MIKVNGAFLPDDEHHLKGLLRNAAVLDGFPTYQHSKLRTSLIYCQRRGLALDVGANVGLWTRWLAEEFAEVHAYEPLRANMDCLVANLPPALRLKVEFSGLALGHTAGYTGLIYGANGPCDARATDAVAIYPMERLDDLVTQPVDYLKVDTCGTEYDVLRGAVRLLETSRPCTVVDVNRPEDAPAIEAFMTARGAKRRENMSGVHVYSWGEPNGKA